MSVSKKVKKKKSRDIQTTGKRRTAVARATLQPGKGKVKINSFYLESYTPEIAKMRIQEPLLLAGDTAKKVDIKVKVEGGGWNGQADAVRLAIGKALVAFNKELKKPFLDYDRQLLIADVRRKEQCKPNDSKARSKRQKSYR